MPSAPFSEDWIHMEIFDHCIQGRQLLLLRVWFLHTNPLIKRVHSKKKGFAPIGATFFPFRIESSEGLFFINSCIYAYKAYAENDNICIMIHLTYLNDFIYFPDLVSWQSLLIPIILWVFQQFHYSRSLDGGVLLSWFDNGMLYFNTSKDIFWTCSFQRKVVCIACLYYHTL